MELRLPSLRQRVEPRRHRQVCHRVELLMHLRAHRRALHQGLQHRAHRQPRSRMELCPRWIRQRVELRRHRHVCLRVKVRLHRPAHRRVRCQRLQRRDHR